MKNNKPNEKKKVLLALLPFWTPLIPPQGITGLKTYLEPYGYRVKTVDATIEVMFKEIYDRYFNRLKTYIPEEKQGNFYNIGHDLLQNHMMAHVNYTDEKKYDELVKILVSKIYFYTIDDEQVRGMKEVLDEFYLRLKEYMFDWIDREKPGVLGLTVHNHTMPASLYIFKKVKESYPHIKTVMGGGIFTEQLSLGSANLEYFLENTPYIDKVLVGEGEQLLLEYLEGNLDESRKMYLLKDIGKRNLEVSAIGVPDLSDLDAAVYPYMGAAASRSCPFQCSFCSEPVFYGKYQKKNVELVVRQMRQTYEKYHHRLFNMTDSLLNPLITDLASEFIKSGLPIYWDGYLRAGEPVREIENTLHWRRGGFYRAQMGIESGSQRILDLMGKRITPELSKASLEALAYAGIKTTTYWVIGHPEETEEDFQKTLDFVEEYKDYIYEAESHPFQYVVSGLVKSGEWSEKSVLLYPESAREMLMVQTWIVDCQPNREEIYNRLGRFIKHCRKLGLPNPYSMAEILKADERWKKLHKNAVPSVMEIRNNITDSQERMNVKNIYRLQKLEQEEDDFDF